MATTLLQGCNYMTTLRASIFACLAFAIIAMASCGGSNPVTGGFSSKADPPMSQWINTDGVVFDGSLLGTSGPGISVAPKTTHLVSIQPKSQPSKDQFRISCSRGSWIVNGANSGDTLVSSEHAYQWMAPERPGAVQLLFEPQGGASNSSLGIVVTVSDSWYLNPKPPAEIDRELSFNNPVTGKPITAAAGELLVKLAPSTSITSILSLRATKDYQVLERISAREPVFRLKFNPDVDLSSAWKSLADDPRIEVVEPNYIAYPAAVPDDPKYGEKFEFPKIDAEQAWDIATGSEDVWVATVDTGADRDHPDLAGNIVSGADFITGGDGFGGETPGDGVDNNQDGAVDQNVGHGTHVAGIIAAQAFNGAGACGIAYNTKIQPLRVFPSNGDTGATFSSIIEAVGYATEEPKVRVISMSIGTTYNSTLLEQAVDTAWANGKVLVAAAANANTSDMYYPGAFDHVVAVAALSKNGVKASFSNYGDWVDISAYGTAIYSTYFNDSYTYMSGTSMACPLVSGCFALLFSYNQNLTNEKAVSFLLQYSDDVYTLNPTYVGQLGSGIVNPFLALSALENDQPGQTSDGNSDGSFSDNQLELGPHAKN
jgi:thermitase